VFVVSSQAVAFRSLQQRFHRVDESGNHGTRIEVKVPLITPAFSHEVVNLLCQRHLAIGFLARASEHAVEMGMLQMIQNQPENIGTALPGI